MFTYFVSANCCAKVFHQARQMSICQPITVYNLSIILIADLLQNGVHCTFHCISLLPKDNKCYTATSVIFVEEFRQFLAQLQMPLPYTYSPC